MLAVDDDDNDLAPGVNDVSDVLCQSSEKISDTIFTRVMSSGNHGRMESNESNEARLSNSHSPKWVWLIVMWLWLCFG